MLSLIDEAAAIETMRVVAFTGGECFLLGHELEEMVSRATARGLITRCVTNGYWAVTRQAAELRLGPLVGAGLKEINFSTGPFHAKFVPVDRIVCGAAVAVSLGLTTVVNVEVFNGDNFETDKITQDPQLGTAIKEGRARLQRNVWIENGGLVQLTHQPEHSRFNESRKSGCATALRVLAVTPDQHLVSCCGLHLEKIPELHIGSVEQKTVKQLIADAPDDFLKIWIHVEGPERILEFVKRHKPDYQLPLHMVHPCETCLHLYRDPIAKVAIQEHYHEVESHVVELYLAGLAAARLNQEFDRDRASFGDS